MRNPQGSVGRFAQTSGREQGAAIRNELGLHEHLREGRMRRVRGRGRQDNLGVRGQFDLTHSIAEVCDADAAYLGIVLGRHQYLGRRDDTPVLTRDFCAVLEERDLISVRLDSGRLITCRPNLTARDVAQKYVRSPGVASGILAPARHRETPETTEAGSGNRHHDRVSAVRQQVGAWRDVMRGIEAPRHGRGQFLQLQGCERCLAAWRRCRGRAGYTFLQEQFVGLNHGFGAETRAKEIVAQHIRDRDQDHALVMRHESAHDDEVLALGHATRREVQRFIPAEAAAGAELRQHFEISQGGARIHHRRERGRIGRDHGIVAKPALQSQTRDAEAHVLIGQFDVASVERRL